MLTKHFYPHDLTLNSSKQLLFNKCRNCETYLLYKHDLSNIRLNSKTIVYGAAMMDELQRALFVAYVGYRTIQIHSVLRIVNRKMASEREKKD